MASILAATAWSCTTPEPATYPIKLNPALGLENTEPATIEARLNGPLRPDAPEDSGIDLYKRGDEFSEDPYQPSEGQVMDRRVASNCVELRALTEAGYFGRYRNDFEVQQGLLGDCNVMDLLRTARASRVSHLRDFVMNAQAIDWLPAMLDTTGSPRRICDGYTADLDGRAWSQVDRIVKFDVVDQYFARAMTRHADTIWREGEYAWSSGALTSVEILAWADFNDDGIEDLLVNTRSNVVTWRLHDDTYSVAQHLERDRFLLTRHKQDTVLRVLDPDKYLTPDRLGDEPCGAL